MKPSLLAAALAVGLASCASRLHVPEPADVELAGSRWPGTTLDDLQRGRVLYVQKCGGCHNLVLPETIDHEVWPFILTEMTPRAKLEEADELAILRFLIISRQRSSSPPLP